MASGNIKKIDYIDAVRGIAILLVVATHCSQYVKPTSELLARLMVEGARGVQLFFVASAITLCMSWAARKPNEKHPIRNFYLRRFFRIAPMFYIAIVGYLLLNGLNATYWAPNGIEWWFIPLTAAFLHGFHPETINSVVPGGWSIAVEMSFYAIFPLLMRFRSAWFFLALFISFGLLHRANAPLAAKVFSYSPEQSYMVVNFATLNFFSQLPVFIAGTLAYIFISRERVHSAWLFIIGGALLSFFCYKFWTLSRKPVSHDVYAGAMFATLVVFLAYYPIKIIVNRAFITLGKLSFSIYLIHFSVLHFLNDIGLVSYLGNSNWHSVSFTLMVLIFTSAIAYFTYRFIEVPGISLGKNLISRSERNQSSTAQVSIEQPLKT